MNIENSKIQEARLSHKQSSMRVNWTLVCTFLVFFVICTQFLLLSDNGSYKTKKSYWIDNPKVLHYEPKFLSSRFASKSRLGNHLFELASILGISKILNRTPIFFIHNKSYQKMIEYTKEIIPGLVDKYLVINGTIVSGFKKMHFPNLCCVFDDPIRLDNVTDTFLDLSGNFYQSYKYFLNDRQNLISYLATKKKFKGLPQSNDTNVITCIHVRRTDFAGYKRFMADENFIINSLEFVENKMSSHIQDREKIVVLFGDDQKFMKNIFNNETHHFISKNSPIDDLLYASQHCNNVLITAPVSTFGWWMGYLSGSDNVFYVDVRKVNDTLFNSGKFNPDDFFLPEWTPLKLDSDNMTVVESRA